jgi:hypothetical protein
VVDVLVAVLLVLVLPAVQGVAVDFQIQDQAVQAMLVHILHPKVIAVEMDMMVVVLTVLLAVAAVYPVVAQADQAEPAAPAVMELLG